MPDGTNAHTAGSRIRTAAETVQLQAAGQAQGGAGVSVNGAWQKEGRCCGNNG